MAQYVRRVGSLGPALYRSTGEVWLCFVKRLKNLTLSRFFIGTSKNEAFVFCAHNKILSPRQACFNDAEDWPGFNRIKPPRQMVESTASMQVQRGWRG